jgi:hypothetical protein
MSRELLQQALNVIIELYNDRGEICNANQLLFNEADKAIKALEQELAKPVNEFNPDWDQQAVLVERIRELEAELAKPGIPTKIVGPNLEEILNAAGFYRGDAVCCNDYEKCIKPCTPKGEWLAKKELAKTEQSEYDKLTVKFGERAKEYLEEAKKSWEPEPEQEPVTWITLNKLAQTIVEEKYLFKRFIDGTPLANDIAVWMTEFALEYAAPPRKPWVGLTEDEVFSCFAMLDMFALAHAIEAKLKEKNT